MGKDTIILTDRERFHKFYVSKDWRLLRLQKLANDPLCEQCLKDDLTVSAEHVHHIISLDVDYSLCLTYNNLMSVCVPCHSRFTQDEQRVKRTGKSINDNMNELEELIRKQIYLPAGGILISIGIKLLQTITYPFFGINDLPLAGIPSS